MEYGKGEREGTDEAIDREVKGRGQRRIEKEGGGGREREGKTRQKTEKKSWKTPMKIGVRVRKTKEVVEGKASGYRRVPINAYRQNE